MSEYYGNYNVVTTTDTLSVEVPKQGDNLYYRLWVKNKATDTIVPGGEQNKEIQSSDWGAVFRTVTGLEPDTIYIVRVRYSATLASYNDSYQDLNYSTNKETLEARTDEESSTITVTLSFNTNGGSPSSYQSVSRTDYPSASGYIDVQIPSNYSPTKTNYDFGGWNIGGNTFDPGDWVGLDSNTTATAKWVREVIVVSLSGTTTSDSITVNAPTGVPNDSAFFAWQLYQGATLKVDDSTNTLGAYKFENLDKGTPYTVKFGAYTAAGGEQTAKGEKSFTTNTSNVWIYTSDGWKLATPYIYYKDNDGVGRWHEAKAYIYTGSGSENGWAPC